MNNLFSKLTLLSCLLVGNYSIQAQVLDQDFYTSVADNSSASVNTTVADNGQSFTAGITGYLTSLNVEIRVQDPGNNCGINQSVSLRVSVYQGNGFGGALLGTSDGVVIMESGFTLQSFSFPTSIFVAAGSQYTFEVNKVNTSCSFFVPQNSLITTGGYSGGTTFTSGVPSSGDFLFQTYVIPCTPPDVPTLAATSSTICNGNSTTLSVASGNLNSATNWQWYSTGCGTGSIGSGTSITVSPSTTTTYYARGEGNCVNPSTCANITITVNDIPATPGAISGSNPICDNTTNTYSISAVAGATSYIWTLPSGWSGTSTTNSISATANASSGSIAVQASNVCGTSGSSTQVITVNTAPPTPGAISGSSIYCPLGTDTYSISAVSTATSYNWTLPSGWSGSSTSTSINATNDNTNGTISVTASNICGTSSGSSSILVVLDNEDPAIPTITSFTAECSATPATPTTTDNCSGVISATTSTSFPITTQGTTIITWTFDDGNGNSVTANQTIILDDVTDPVTPTLSTLMDECSLTPTAPTTTDACVGTITGTTSTIFPITTQGTTVVTWTFDDGNGNTTTANQTIIIDDVTDPVVPTLSNLTDDCSVTPIAPTTTDACAGTITGTTGTTFPITTPGTTVVTWTFNDGNGNSSTALQNVIIDDVTAPVISGCPSDITINVNNNGCSAIVTWTDPTATDNCGGTPTVTSNKNSGDVFLPGTTTVTFTFEDAAGNTTSCSFDVIVINDFGVTGVSNTDVSCNGGSDGAIDITVAGGATPYTFDWNSGAFSVEDPTGLNAGVYNGFIVDFYGCADAGSITIHEPTLIDIDIVSFTNPLNCGVNNGTVNITVTGGTEAGAYTYLWDDGISYTSTLEDPTNLPSGGIAISVTDDNGCMVTDFLALTDPNGPTITYSNSSDTLLSCNGDSDAFINIDVVLNGGATSAIYDWNLGTFSTEDISGLSAGTYGVTVTDNHGCASGAVFSFGEPTALSISNNVSDVICNSTSTGSIDITVTGGTVAGAYVFDWNSGAFATEDLNSIPAGTYDIVITDDNGCTANDSYTISEPSAITITLDASSDANCNGAADGSIDISATGGTEIVGYDYDWNAGTFTTEDLTAIAAGTYSVDVMDDNGCVETASFSISEPTLITISANVTDASCNGFSDGAINITVTGGTEAGTYDFDWNSGASTNEDLTSLATGNYSVAVMDDNGCIVTDNYTVNEPAAIDVTTTTAGITISANNTLATYQWINCPSGTVAIGTSTNQSYTATANGDYAVIVSQNGCSDTSACVTISTIGLIQLEDESTVSIYPNPTTGVFTIVLNENAQVVVTDAIGKIIESVQLNNGQHLINLTAEMNGIYFVKVNTENQQVIKKIILNR